MLLHQKLQSSSIIDIFFSPLNQLDQIMIKIMANVCVCRTFNFMSMLYTKNGDCLFRYGLVFIEEEEKEDCAFPVIVFYLTS